ncbi:MAG: heme-binding protein [Pseudomonadota bacterium]
MPDLFRRAAAVLAVLICGEAALAYEEPEYRVVATTDVFEVREYDSYIVAETRVTGNLRRSGSVAFRRLAGYIFGKNVQQQKMNMTAPVETRRADNEATMMLAQPSGEQSFRYAFVMERQYNLDTLPTPVDDSVSLREVPGRTVAVRTFSGRWTDKNYQRHETELVNALRAAGYRLISAPMLARYDGPLTPWFMRRNEVMVEVEEPAAADGM